MPQTHFDPLQYSNWVTVMKKKTCMSNANAQPNIQTFLTQYNQPVEISLEPSMETHDHMIQVNRIYNYKKHFS